MRATGIVRRVDDLGRIVIPREIRRSMRIKEGDPLEIYTTKEGEVIFKKYSYFGETTEEAQRCAKSLSAATDMGILISDTDCIIANAGTINVRERRITTSCIETFDSKTYVYDGKCAINPLEGTPVINNILVGCAVPIITNYECIGYIMAVFNSENTMKKIDLERIKDIITPVARILSSYFDD